MNKKIKNILSYYKNLLKNHKIDTYHIDVEVLLMNATNFEKTKLYLSPDYVLTDEQYNIFLKNINRRLKNEPIAYILEKCEFMKINFLLNKNTLIPRPDTEILASLSIDIIKKNNLKTVLDIGTGSGAIAISLAKYCENISITAVDINENTLKIAKKNAILNNISNINFIKSDIFENIFEKFDIIVSNPPYIKTNVIKYLDNNVKDYEPHIALDGGKDGLLFYNNITKNAHKYLNNGGYVAFEIGYDQKNDVFDIMKNYGFSDITAQTDYNGLDRAIYGKII